MSLSVGIIGLPNVGKSTLFKALTKKQVDISNYPFCTIEPNTGMVQVPDGNLEKLANIAKPEKITPSIIKFVDIAGLVKGAHKGEGLGNQFLSYIREVDLLAHVVRGFENENISHVHNKINPKHDIETIKTELALKDLETIKKYEEKITKLARANNKEAQNELEILLNIKKALDTSQEFNKPEQELTEKLQLLSSKKMIYVINTDNSTSHSNGLKNTLHLNIKLESELAELTPEEIKELEMPKPKLDQLINACYNALHLISFYTIVGSKEIRAWPLEKNSNAYQAAGKVHTDFADHFIKAEVISVNDLLKSGSLQSAREKGLLRTEGKEYIIQNQDIIEFKI